MCLGVPMRVERVSGLTAHCAAADGRKATVDLSLTGPVAPGCFVLVFLSAAREVLDAPRAEAIARALAGLQAVLAGGELGDAFADLEAREPTLPPHLEAARRAGAPTG